MRTVKLQYNTTQLAAEHNLNKIFYKVVQCKDKDDKVTGEKVYFSYSQNGGYKPLPPGCPPPIVQKPPVKDECQNGVEIGNAVSRTIAEIITPRLLEDDPSNPFYEESVFKKVKDLNKQFEDLQKERTGDEETAQNLEEKLKEAIREYELLV